MRRTRSLQSGVVAAIVAMLVLGRRGAAVAAALVAFVALSPFLIGCDLQPRTGDQPRTIVMDDFESGAITDWQAVGSGSGGWFVYTHGQMAERHLRPLRPARRARPFPRRGPRIGATPDGQVECFEGKQRLYLREGDLGRRPSPRGVDRRLQLAARDA
jgi:hypothetical protein